MKIVSIWLSSAALALAIAAVPALMDGPDDTTTAQTVADDYDQAIKDGGKAKCAALGRDPLWTKSGDLVCRERGHVAGGKP